MTMEMPTRLRFSPRPSSRTRGSWRLSAQWALPRLSPTLRYSTRQVFCRSVLAHHIPICASRATGPSSGLVPNEQVQGGALARLAQGELGATTVAVVHDNDAFGTAVADNFSEAFAGLGGTVGTRQGFDRGQTTFDDVASGVAASSPEVVFFAVHATEGLAVSSAIRAAGVKTPFLGTDGLKTSFFLGGGEPDAEAYHTHSGADFRRLETAKEFRDAYVERWPEDSTYSPEAYDSAMIVVESLARAGTVSRDRVLEEFLSLDGYEGITGAVRFDATGEREDSPVSWYKVGQTDAGRVMEYQGTVS